MVYNFAFNLPFLGLDEFGVFTAGRQLFSSIVGFDFFVLELIALLLEMSRK